eukprot:GILI01026363.1.p1 GENE.GILI01026363.1~~GILI01026363.1.p1  ORF type:complete len:132 (-),score=0.38 GILI01026363.1:54-449(-)
MICTMKRRNPFGEDRESKFVQHSAPHQTSFFENTLQMLLSANQNSMPLPDLSRAEGVCGSCTAKREITGCAYCTRPTCDFCVRQCEKCLDVFCTMCCVFNYDLRVDRTFCLSCNDEERRFRNQMKSVQYSS